MLIADESGAFDTILGLPVHPLAVHVPVVLLPLAALAVLALVAVPRWRRPLAWPTLGLLLVGAVGAFVAKESGEALADRLGDPGAHEDWGGRLLLTSIALLVVGGLWLTLVRRGAARSRADGGDRATGASSGASPTRSGSALHAALGALAALTSVGVLALTVVTGHSGAEAAWKERLEDAARTAPPTGSPAPQETPGAPGTEPAGPSGAPAQGATATAASYTMAQVAERNTREACWTVVEREVYDVTAWIARHPGGQARIEGLCGTDGSARFSGKHGEAPTPNATLAGFRIGALTD